MPTVRIKNLSGFRASVTVNGSTGEVGKDQEVSFSVSSNARATFEARPLERSGFIRPAAPREYTIRENMTINLKCDDRDSLLFFEPSGSIN